MSGRTAFNLDLARALIDRKRDIAGAALPILHDLQEEFGYIDDNAIPLIADALNISRAETLGVISFYHDFRRSPVDGRVLKLCRAESCQSMGCEALVSHLEQRLGVRMGETTADGAVTLQTVYCLGNCALSPSVLMDRDLYGRVSPERAEITARYASRSAIVALKDDSKLGGKSTSASIPSRSCSRRRCAAGPHPSRQEPSL